MYWKTKCLVAAGTSPQEIVNRVAHAHGYRVDGMADHRQFTSSTRDGRAF